MTAEISFDLLIVEAANRRSCSKVRDSANIDVTIMIIRTFQQDDHVVVLAIMTNAVYEAATGYVLTFKG